MVQLYSMCMWKRKVWATPTVNDAKLIQNLMVCEAMLVKNKRWENSAAHLLPILTLCISAIWQDFSVFCVFYVLFLIITEKRKCPEKLNVFRNAMCKHCMRTNIFTRVSFTAKLKFIYVLMMFRRYSILQKVKLNFCSRKRDPNIDQFVHVQFSSRTVQLSDIMFLG